jgi:hypothetical protein
MTMESIHLARGNKPEKRAMGRKELGILEDVGWAERSEAHAVGPYSVGTALRAFAHPTSALARLETALRLIDNVDAALAPHQAVVAMAAAQRFQRVTDFHGAIPCSAVD